jgi:hypothetical protein
MSGVTATKALRAALEKECEQRLAGLGFYRGRRPSLLIDLVPGFRGTFVPIWKPYSRHVVVGLYPSVGVIDLVLEAEIGQRGGRLAPSYSTYQTPLLNVIPVSAFPQDSAEIWFDNGPEGRRAMDWFIETMSSTAVPWMRRWTEDGRLAAEILRLDDLSGTADDFRIGAQAPLLELRRGEPNRALARLERHVFAMKGRRDAIGDGYRAFATALRAELVAIGDAKPEA